MSSLGNFVWSIADQLRGVYKPHQYGNVILPMTILRRLDCILEPSRDEVRALLAEGKPEPLVAQLLKARHGLNFYNTSEYDMERLKKDPDGLRANLIDYISRFSANIDVFERFKFENEIATLDEKNRLYLVVAKFAEVDLHPDTVSNAAMGDLFEHLIRKFAEASNETAGEHFTPRDAIRLMVDLLFAEDNDALLEPGIVRSVYDPAAGTGGMLSVSEEHLLMQNPDARLTMYGQELNDQSYAICKSDMIAKGQDPTNIRLGDTLAEDHFAGKTFDYCLSNPPYGLDWKASEHAVKAERQTLGAGSRFHAGLPKIGDGQMLFLSHLASKMRPVTDGGGRAGIVLNGSPLFNGAAESGESEIRRWLLESDLVDAIVALPTNMFFNTDIATYIWILDNTKQAERVGKVQLIDGSGFFTKMRKNLGDKSRDVSEADRKTIVELYAAFETNDHSKVFATDDFGYWTITVERPLRLNFVCTPERIDTALCARPLAKAEHDTLRAALAKVGEQVYTNREEFLAVLDPALKAEGATLTAPQKKAMVLGLSERDEDADPCLDPKGKPEPDVSLRGTENIPFTWSGIGGRADRDGVIRAYFDTEVVPHAPDTWIDHTKTKTGYEIPFTRHFYKYVPPRPLEEIDADLNELVRLIETLLERRSAVVDSVVTKGLDASASHKPSGSDWLGDIPSHWEVRPLWSMFQRIKDVDHPEERMLSVFRDYGVIAKESRDNINVTADNRSIYQLVHPGWLVTNRMKAWQGSVGISPLRGIVSGHYICFAPRHGEDHRYLNWLFRAPRYTTGYRLISRGVRVGQAEIDNDQYRVMPVIVPPISEQREIANYLDRQTAKIDLLLSKTERFIELARESRSALINAVVTGQIDVRDELF